jgi:hypothetical protein
MSMEDNKAQQQALEITLAKEHSEGKVQPLKSDI